MKPVMDRLFLCESRRAVAFTDFYDPVSWTGFLEEAQKAARGVRVAAFGGAEDCERRMLGFFPSENGEEPFPISRLRISHNAKFNKAPRHQDYLGSILGLGLDRGKLGDIICGEAFAEAFVHEDIAGYVCGQLEKVGRVPVSVEVSAEAGIERAEEVEVSLNVASLRLDVMVAALFRLSRGKAAAYIRAEKVFLNWGICADGGKQLKEGDMVSLRGFGRGQVGEVLGSTKKGRLRVGVRCSR